MTEIPNSVDNVPSHHRGAQGRDFAGRKHSGGSGAVAAGGGWCSWLRTGLSCPWGGLLAVAGSCWRDCLAAWLCDCRRLLALVCLWASGFCGVGHSYRYGIRPCPPRGTPEVVNPRIWLFHNMDASLWVVCAALVVVAAIRRRIAALAEPKRTAEFLKGKRVMITVRAVPRRRPHCIWYSVARARRVPAVVLGGRWP